MYGYIYKFTILINNKSYIGQHKSNEFDETYWGSGKEWRRALAKYGKENVKREILEECNSQDELDEKEIYWIYKLDAINSNNYYNIAPGGQAFFTGCHHSDESKSKISKRSCNSKWMEKDNKFKFVSSENIESMLSNGWKLKGVPNNWNSELKNKVSNDVSIKNKGRIRLTNGKENVFVKTIFAEDYINAGYKKGVTMKNKGRRHWYNNNIEEKVFYECDNIPEGWLPGRLPITDLTKKKLSEWNKLHPSRKGSPIKCIELNKIYCNINEIKKEFGTKGKVWECCRGVRQKSLGYHWEWANKDE